jgi:hypothetical protein
MPMLAERPIQVYLEDRQDRALRHIAVERGVSLSEIIRESVDTWLLQIAPDADPAMSLIDLGAAPVVNLGSAHDDHLDSIYMEEMEREV